MALNTSMYTLLQGMNRQNIAIEPTRCISVRNRNATCQRCVDSCAAGVLHRENGELHANASLCIACGTCANACPTGAITLAHPSTAEIAAAAKQSLVAFGGYTVFCCEQAAQQAAQIKGYTSEALSCAKVCELPCLGHVDESLLVEQAARGAHGVFLVHGACESCAHAAGGKLCKEVCESAASLLHAFRSECTIELTEEWPPAVIDAVQKAQDCCGAAASATGDAAPSAVAGAGEGEGEAEAAAGDAAPSAAAGAGADEGAAKAAAGAGSEAGGALDTSTAAGAPDTSAAADAPDTSAYSLDTSAAADAPGALDDLYVKVGKQGTLSHHIPLKRTRLYNCLRHLGNPTESQVETRLVGRVEIDTSKCMSCRMCAVFCPTGALVAHGAPENEEEPFGLMHRPSLCMQCRCCEQICAKGAITVTPKLTLTQFLGKEELFLELKRPQWLPNTPESMYDKFASMFGPNINTGHF